MKNFQTHIIVEQTTMKDYELIITANDDIVKFTVKDKSRFEDYKGSIIVALLAVLAYIVSGVISKTLENHNVTKTDMVQIIALLAALLISYSRRSREDTMIVMKNIGIQLQYQSNWKFLFNKSANKNTFIPVNNIIDLVIHEGFYGYGQVIYYMCVLTKTNPNVSDNDMIKVVFSELLPRKHLLITVWKQSREILFNNKRMYWRRVPGQGLKPVQ